MKRGLKVIKGSPELLDSVTLGCTHCPDEKGTERILEAIIICTHCPDEKGTERMLITVCCTHCPDEKGTERLAHAWFIRSHSWLHSLPR